MKNLICLFCVLLLTSCSSYVNSIQKDIEYQEQSNREVDTGDRFDQYRNNKRRSSSQYNNFNRTITTNNEKILLPNVRRQYVSEKEALKRTTSSDFEDNGTDGSLWGGNNQNNFLFTNNKNKSVGDIVQIKVLANLKTEITQELKKAFPDNPFENKKPEEEKISTEDKAAKPAEEEKKKTIAQEKDKEKEASVTDTTPDKISSVVIEEINREHLLLKGKKSVLFKNKKRLVEVQALVSRKDVDENGIVNSDSIIESNISILKQ